MSLEITANNHITLTRGDTGIIDLLFTLSGQPYTPQEGDTATFTVRKNYKGKPNDEVIIQKEIDMSEAVLIINPDETSELEYYDYKYDISCTYSNGIVETPIVGIFTLDKEVT